MACGCTRWVAQVPAVASRSSRADIAVAIAQSFQLRTGRELVPTSDADIDAALMNSPAVILCHDGATDPHFIYANKAAAVLWRISVEQLIGMPSRMSALPEHRTERARSLAQAATDGVLFGYCGERVAADGTRFEIEDATLWTVDLPAGGRGQAVVFDTWRELPDPGPANSIR